MAISTTHRGLSTGRGGRRTISVLHSASLAETGESICHSSRSRAELTRPQIIKDPTQEDLIYKYFTSSFWGTPGSPA